VKEQVSETMRLIADHISRVAERVAKDELVDKLIEKIASYRDRGKIFVHGAGRSGLVGRSFAMRLMHIGLNVYVVGETITPRVEEGDLFIAISGSGKTLNVVNAAKVAKEVAKAYVVAITSNADSPLAEIADMVIIIPGRTKEQVLSGDYYIRQITGKHYTRTPLGTLFETTTLVFLDGIVAALMEKFGLTEEHLVRRHANIEGRVFSYESMCSSDTHR